MCDARHTSKLDAKRKVTERQWPAGANTSVRAVEKGVRCRPKADSSAALTMEMSGGDATPLHTHHSSSL